MFTSFSFLHLHAQNCHICVCDNYPVWNHLFILTGILTLFSKTDMTSLTLTPGVILRIIVISLQHQYLRFLYPSFWMCVAMILVSWLHPASRSWIQCTTVHHSQQWKCFQQLRHWTLIGSLQVPAVLHSVCASLMYHRYEHAASDISAWPRQLHANGWGHWWRTNHSTVNSTIYFIRYCPPYSSLEIASSLCQ